MLSVTELAALSASTNMVFIAQLAPTISRERRNQDVISKQYHCAGGIIRLVAKASPITQPEKRHGIYVMGQRTIY